jgi:hypothetical protein
MRHEDDEERAWMLVGQQVYYGGDKGVIVDAWPSMFGGHTVTVQLEDGQEIYGVSEDQLDFV